MIDQAQIEKMVSQLEAAEARLFEMRRTAQQVFFNWLVDKYGGLRKAADAVGMNPSNFHSIGANRRDASVMLMRKMLCVEAAKK